MKILLFVISIIYSLIFYVFYTYSNGLNIFLKKIYISYDIVSFSTNLLFESILFFVIGLFFYFKFTDFLLKNNTTKKIVKNSEKDILNIIFSLTSVIVFGLLVYVLSFYITNNFLLLNLIGLILNLIFFFLFVKIFTKRKKLFKIIGIIFIYISTIAGVIYMYINGINYILIVNIIYSILFNLIIHVKYNNYISLIFGLLTFISLIFLFYEYI